MSESISGCKEWEKEKGVSSQSEYIKERRVPFFSSIVTVSLAHFMRNLKGVLAALYVDGRGWQFWCVVEGTRPDVWIAEHHTSLEAERRMHT